MSLEKALEANTVAVLRLVALMEGKAEHAPSIPQIEEVAKPVKKAAPAPAPEPVEKDLTTSDAPLEWADIHMAFLKFMETKGRDAAKAMLVAHGVPGKLSPEALPEAKRAGFYHALQA